MASLHSRHVLNPLLIFFIVFAALAAATTDCTSPTCAANAAEEEEEEASLLQRPCFGASAGDGWTWVGANSYYLWALDSSDQSAVLQAMQQNGITVLRIFVVSVISSPPATYPKDGTSAKTYYDIEYWTVGNFAANATRYQILDKIDHFMYLAHKHGIKLSVMLHDRYSLGVDLNDAYVHKNGLPANHPANAQNLTNFYYNQSAMTDIDNRLQFLLQHKNPYLGDKPWGMLSEAVFAVGIQNEAQGHVASTNMGLNFDWWCGRAKAMKPYVGNGVQITSGGTWNLQSAIDNKANFACAEIDILPMHSYNPPGNDYDHLIGKLNAAVGLAKKASPPKRIIFEEFGQPGTDQNARGAALGLWMAAANSVGVPFMPWQVMKPGNACPGWGCMNFWTNDLSWTELVKWTATAAQTPGRFSWPELLSVLKADGALCGGNGECSSGCCSQAGTGSSFTCVAASASAKCTGALLKSQSLCTVNSQCQSGCCSNGYPVNSPSNAPAIFKCVAKGSPHCTGFFCPYLDGGCNGLR